MQAKVESWTPAKAKAQLENSNPNRSLSDKWVSELCRRSDHGEFVMNGEPIIIDAAGKLLDGQHRLWMVVKTGRTVEMMTVRGVSKDVFGTIDGGKPRNLGTILESAGEKYTTLLAATSRILMAWMDGIAALSPREPRTTFAQFQLVAKIFPHIRESAALADTVRRRADLKPASIAAMHALMRLADPDACARFWEGVETGANLAESDSRFRLREAAAKDRRLSIRRPPGHQEWQTVKAWNLFMADRECRQLSVRDDEIPLPLTGIPEGYEFGAWLKDVGDMEV